MLKVIYSSTSWKRHSKTNKKINFLLPEKTIFFGNDRTVNDQRILFGNDCMGYYHCKIREPITLQTGSN
jgi:hypothetical protein